MTFIANVAAALSVIVIVTIVIMVLGIGAFRLRQWLDQSRKER